MPAPPGRARLVALSSLMLFVELGLIRWSGAYNVYLSFFTNFVLLASFLGVGVGFLRGPRGPDLLRYAPVALLSWCGFVVLFPVEGARVEGVLRVVGGFGLPALPRWISLAAIFALAFAVMATIAQGVAASFVRFAPLRAYRLDILGSLAGIAAFAALSFLELPPLVWGVIVAGVLLAVGGRTVVTVAATVGFVAMLGALSIAPRTYWSPYQRIEVAEAASDGSIEVRVNGRPHQRIMPLETLEAGQSFRYTPYEHVATNPLTNVLIVGAGTGNDVAIALERGAAHVDAVEIDPVLARLGDGLHPDRPYDDPRVEVHVDDARAFLHDAPRRYDLVLFAIPDSLTAFAGQSSLRVENFLFTREAIREVRDHLTRGGAVAFYHYLLPNVIDRYAVTLRDEIGSAPCVDTSPGAGPRPRVVLTAAVDPGSLACTDTWQAPAGAPEPDTDDHPFPYLASRGIPGFYAVALALILLASVAVVRATPGPLSGMRPYVDLFCMGAAFLLLETMNVVRFALLFGTTWFVNALVFMGILATILVAIEVAERRRTPRPAIVCALLFASVALAWAIEPTVLLSLPVVPRFLAAAVLGFAPVGFANLLFAERFRDVGSSTVAFGANLLGAIVGGVLEYAALATGYRALLLVAAVLYALAVLGRPRAGASAPG